MICGIEVTPDKAGEVLFSNPYYVTFEQFVDRRGTPPITSLDQLNGKQSARSTRPPLSRCSNTRRA